MNILEELYYGNIGPFERGFGKGEQCCQLLQYISRHEKTLRKGLTEDQQTAFEKYRDTTRELQDLTERDAFICGFKLGGRLILEITRQEPPEPVAER